MGTPSRRILVIDDEESFRQMLSDYLRSQGFRVEVAHDGLEGFRRATREQFDLVVADINMPGVNGVETIRSLKLVDSPVAVVVVSGYVTDEIEADCRQAGCVEVLAKPVELAHLGEVITGVLGGSAPSGDRA